MWFDDKISLGTVLIRVVTNKDASDLISRLKKENDGVTIKNPIGALGSVQIILTIIKRIHIPRVVSLIKQFNPQAFLHNRRCSVRSKGYFATIERGLP